MPTGGTLSKDRRAARASWLLVVTSLLWGGAGLLIRATPLSGEQLAFWRCLTGAVAYQLVLAAQGRPPRWASFKTAALGGVGFGASLVLQFVAYKTTTLVSANVIFVVQPLLLGVAARHLHGDRHGRSALPATLAAIAGTVVVMASSTSSGAWSLHGDLLAAVSMLIGCLYPIGTKNACLSMDPLEFQASLLWTASLIALPAAAFTGRGLAPPPLGDWPWIVAIVAVGGTGHILFATAQRHVSVMASSTITLAEIVVVAVGAALAFHQSVSIGQIAGMLVVAAAVGWWVAGRSDVASIESPAFLPQAE